MITTDDIKKAVCAEFGTPLIEMTSGRRGRLVVRPRQVAMFLCKELTPLSLPAIGRKFGSRDHTTVMHAIVTVGRLRSMDADFAEMVNRVMLRFATAERLIFYPSRERP